MWIHLIIQLPSQSFQFVAEELEFPATEINSYALLDLSCLFSTSVNMLNRLVLFREYNKKIPSFSLLRLCVSWKFQCQWLRLSLLWCFCIILIVFYCSASNALANANSYGQYMGPGGEFWIWGLLGDGIDTPLRFL